MQRKIDQRIIDLYDAFTHGHLSRRSFMERLSALVGSATAASALLPLLTNDYARAAIVAPDDERITAEQVTYPGSGGEVSGYLVHQKGEEKRPAVIVIHENRGLNPHIEDVTRRIALEGFLALGPDLLSPLGGTPENEDEARDMIGKLDQEATVANLVAAVTWLEQHPLSSGKVGVIGFCWGGGMVNRLAAASPELDAAVSYYGAQVPAEEVPKIQAPLLLHYAGLDTRINAGIEDYRKALEANNKTFQIHVYEGANHAFNNDTNAARYDEAAAKLAWQRTVDFLKQYLS